MTCTNEEEGMCRNIQVVSKNYFTCKYVRLISNISFSFLLVILREYLTFFFKAVKVLEQTLKHIHSIQWELAKQFCTLARKPFSSISLIMPIKTY